MKNKTRIRKILFKTKLFPEILGSSHVAMGKYPLSGFSTFRRHFWHAETGRADRGSIYFPFPQIDHPCVGPRQSSSEVAAGNISGFSRDPAPQSSGPSLVLRAFFATAPGKLSWEPRAGASLLETPSVSLQSARLPEPPGAAPAARAAAHSGWPPSCPAQGRLAAIN